MASRRLHSHESPRKPLSMKWVPKGMDSSLACRIAVRVPHYVEVCPDGSHVVHPDSDLQLVVDRDTTNLFDLIEEISEGVKHGTNQGISISFWNRTTSAFTNLTSDAILMYAMDLYWEMRRLPLFVSVYDTVTVDHSQSVSVLTPLFSQWHVLPPLQDQTVLQATLEVERGGSKEMVQNPLMDNVL